MPTCPVCNCPDVEARDEHGFATFEICPCCGTEFGYDDASASFEDLREAWISGGCVWWNGKPPEGWDAKEQLEGHMN